MDNQMISQDMATVLSKLRNLFWSFLITLWPKTVLYRHEEPNFKVILNKPNTQRFCQNSSTVIW